MAEVKWIKIVTDIFDDEKMLLIETLPDADSLIVIWFKLLCLAGKNNNNGVFLMSERIAYTEEMLASIFRRPINTVRLALSTFEKYGMIEIIDGVITIPNWGKHQTLDAYERRKERDRLYQAKKREQQRALIQQSSDSSSDSSSDVGSLEEDIEEDIEKEKEEDREIKKKSVKEKAPKHKFGTYEHVLLTDDEFNKLAVDFGQEVRDKAITFLDSYIEEKGYKAKSHNLTIRRWVIDAVAEREGKRKQNNRGVSQINDTEDAIKAFLSGREN